MMKYGLDPKEKLDKQLILVEENFLPVEDLYALLNECLARDLEQMRIHDVDRLRDGSSSRNNDSYPEYEERHTNLILDESNSINAFVACNVFEEQHLWKIDQQVVDRVSKFYGEPLTIHCTYFYRYTPGGFLRSHSDNSHFDETETWLRSEPFDFTALIYLNDGFTGGEICVDDLGIELKPKAGMILALPSQYLHSVKPLTSGIRCAYSLKLCGNGVIGLRTKREQELRS
jgi:hypothetical protein